MSLTLEETKSSAEYKAVKAKNTERIGIRNRINLLLFIIDTIYFTPTAKSNQIRLNFTRGLLL